MEQAVILHIPLREAEFGSAREIAGIQELENDIEAIIAADGIDELDGDEFRKDRCVIYLYGPDADSLFLKIIDCLRKHAIADGGFAIKRYGSASDKTAAELRVSWHQLI